MHSGFCLLYILDLGLVYLGHVGCENLSIFWVDLFVKNPVALFRVDLIYRLD